MITPLKHIALSVCLLLICINRGFSAEENSLLKPFHSNQPFGNRVFMPNKGQFGHVSKGRDSIYFALEDGIQGYYFTKNGFYCVLSGHKPSQAKTETEEEKSRRVSRRVKLEWLGANPHCQYTALDTAEGLFSFGDAAYRSRACKTLIRHNLYPHTDLVYHISDSGGFRYSLILNPGADPAKIRFRYSGKKTEIRLQDNRITVNNGLQTLAETGLQVFDGEGRLLSSAYRYNNGVFSFVADNWPRNSRILIDPWVGVLGAQGGPHGHDVDYDNEGNLYVFGGLGCVSKYNQKGSLIWTWMGTVPSINWSYNYYISNFVVDKPSGKVYIGQGFSTSGSQIIRLDSSGNYDQFVTARNPAFQELWDMNFNCANGTIYGMGGSTSSNLNVGAFDAGGNFSPANITGLNGTNQDILSSAQNARGQLFVMMASRYVSGANNKLFLLNSALNGHIWRSALSGGSFTEWDNKTYYSRDKSNGFNALAANNTYVFVYDGKNIAAFNVADGSVAGSTGISGNALKLQGGIVADECNNIYLGGYAGVIHVLYFDGYNFKQKNDIVISGANAPVFDIKLNPFNNMLYYSGKGFVGRTGATEPCKTDSALPVSLVLDCSGMKAVIRIADTSKLLDYTFRWTNVNTGISVKYKSGIYTSDTLFNTEPGREYTVQVVKSAICNLAGALISFKTCDTIYADVNRSVCAGDTFRVNGKSYWSEGHFRDTVTDRNLKTHYLNIKIRIQHASSDTLRIQLCYGDSFRYKNKFYTGDTLIRDSLRNYLGCDSLLIIDLKTKPVIEREQVLEICYGDTLKIGRHAYFENGRYTDTLQTAGGCDSVVNTSLRLKFRLICQCGKPMRMPNVFTPNRDGVNEFFPDSAVQGMELNIYNRWGILIYSNTDGYGWNGLFKGNAVPDGTYYYMMHYTDCDKVRRELHGIVRLIY